MTKYRLSPNSTPILTFNVYGVGTRANLRPAEERSRGGTGETMEASAATTTAANSATTADYTRSEDAR